MTAPASGYVPAPSPVRVVVRQPVKPEGHKRLTGTLLGSMFDRGQVHHHRISMGDGVLLLAPPAWVLDAPDLPEPPPARQGRSHIHQAKLQAVLRELRRITGSHV